MSGFRPLSSNPKLRSFESSAVIATGDIVKFDGAGTIAPSNHVPGGLIAGVAASAATGAGEDVLVYFDPNELYKGLANDTVTLAKVGDTVDGVGATGAMQCAPGTDANVYITIVGLYDEAADYAAGAGNNDLVVKIEGHAITG